MAKARIPKVIFSHINEAYKFYSLALRWSSQVISSLDHFVPFAFPDRWYTSGMVSQCLPHGKKKKLWYSISF